LLPKAKKGVDGRDRPGYDDKLLLLFIKHIFSGPAQGLA